MNLKEKIEMIENVIDVVESAKHINEKLVFIGESANCVQVNNKVIEVKNFIRTKISVKYPNTTFQMKFSNLDKEILNENILKLYEVFENDLSFLNMSSVMSVVNINFSKKLELVINGQSLNGYREVSELRELCFNCKLGLEAPKLVGKNKKWVKYSFDINLYQEKSINFEKHTE